MRRFRTALSIFFLLHAVAFLVFLTGKLRAADFPVRNLGAKLGSGLVVAALAAVAYWFFLRRISPVRTCLRLLANAALLYYFLTLVMLAVGFAINPPITLTQMGSVLQGYGLHRVYVDGAGLGRNIKLAVIASEDRLYADHDGFDVRAIKMAMKYNHRHPDRARGASTISQQTAKNIFLWQGGGFFRKGIETFYTFTIETLWGKKTILDRYLNIAETGPGTFGVQAAAKKYFNKDASALSVMEAAKIAACLPNPKYLCAAPASAYVNARAARIADQMQALAQDPEVREITGP